MHRLSRLRVRPDEHQVPFWLTADYVDPDFDAMGGELTLRQIRDPLPEGEDAHSYFKRKYERVLAQRRYERIKALAARQRHIELVRLELLGAQERLKKAAYRLLHAREVGDKARQKREADTRLAQERAAARLQAERLAEQRRVSQEVHNLWANFRRALATTNPRCVGCTPYNGHHTPGYWGTNRQDCW